MERSSSLKGKTKMTQQFDQVLKSMYERFRKHFFENGDGERGNENDCERAFLTFVGRSIWKRTAEDVTEDERRLIDSIR